ncbi:bifunctional biotin--[acetyl-CoA-carboxylase] ligase/biotin operon repressor BirA [Aequoribacter sp.]|uniref:bifunctional biotin--[acetyl-CoA-carboxylase] ligase/biotin operon repressor BirA n=3 Tax=Aequoribacter sp. TaxID=2847771 RepID=UPI003C478339
MNTQLLQVLADGEWHSGQALADAAGVSRVAMWKQLQKLQEAGVTLEAVKSVGHRIVGGLDLLTDADVLSALDPATENLMGELQVLQQIDSTNRVCQEVMGDRAQPGKAIVVSAEQQTAGRGRRGKAWVSPYARNMYLSVGWQVQGGAAALQGLSLAIGVAVVRALQDLGVATAQLKWPNDVVVGRQKLGGILIELTGDMAGPCSVVVGMGLNVNMPEYAQDGIDQAWTDVYQQGVKPARAALIAGVLNQVLPLLKHWEQSGFEPWREAWQTLDAYRDQPVNILMGDKRIAGTERGVDRDGAIQIETTTGVQSFHGGEVSLRPQS